ncbi:putative small lipoprotein YifL [Streptococcus moroccensis]|uniref:Small lipoprotein YifL n=1 Tax=Streptococcus moroccensis TaxID=1451356 RepID=A0ABT9YR39_9STRE|nr:putative small lipoprotein YifL [Streptococcus moroccensis]
MKLMNSGNRLSNRSRISALLLALMLLLLTGCSSTGPAETGALTESGSAEETTLPTAKEPASENEASEPYSTKSSLPEGTDRMFYAHVNGKVLKILRRPGPHIRAFRK